jgi:predicted metalloprotease with PDZ domain
MTETTEYGAHIEDAAAHRAAFSVRIPVRDGAPVEIVLPAWVPGSYHIRDGVRFVYRLRAQDPKDGRALRVDRLEKARWRIQPDHAAVVEALWEVYGNDLITEAVDVDDTHFFLNAALCLPYVEGRKEEPVELVVHVPDGWKVYSELPIVGQHPTRLRAPDYDTLVDNPIDCGTPEEHWIRPAGIPHRFLFCGTGGNLEPHRLEQDLTRAVEAAIRLFGESPVTQYTFFYHLTDRPDGGLEHANSCSIVASRNAFRPSKSYRRALVIATHEYLHLYNVKRIRPNVLGPFDYTQENYTRLLWWMEGTTDYYAYLLLRRAKVLSLPHFYELIAELVRRYLDTPGRSAQSLEELSIGTWTDLYRAHEETPNRSVSYYLKGLLVSLALDLEIRHRTENRASLDDALLKLWRDFGRVGRGIPEDGLLAVVNAASGIDMSDFFRRHVSGRDEVDLPRVVRFAGLTLAPKERDPKEEDESGWIGVQFRDEKGVPRLSTVYDGSPARRAGLSPGDLIIALDGGRMSFDRFEKVWERYPPGASVEVAYFRRDLLRKTTLTTSRGPPEKYTFTPVDAPTELERRIFESWLETPWEKPGADSAGGKPTSSSAPSIPPAAAPARAGSP